MANPNSETRVITDHKINDFNETWIEVLAADNVRNDGAHHVYKIGVAGIHFYTLEFQTGAPSEVGANGITDQSLVAIVLDRMRGFQTGKFKNSDNEVIIDLLNAVLMQMGHRSRERSSRGVDGKMEV